MWHACGTRPGLVGHMFGDSGAHSEYAGKRYVHPIAPPARYAALGRVGLPGKVSTRDAAKRLRIVVQAAGWLHSMVLHGRAGSWSS